MKRSIGLVLAFLLLACGGSPPRPAPARDPGPVAPTYVGSLNAFGLDVWGALRPQQSGNLAISPASLGVALAMTYGGARGDTAIAMGRALRVGTGPDATMRDAGALVSHWNTGSSDAVSSDGYVLSVANRLFGERSYPFRDAFLAATRDQLGAELEPLDFASAPDPSREHINDWVLAQTHERIRDLLPGGSITTDTRLVLVNAVYFHGRWARPFEPGATQPARFRVNGTTDALVPTMHATGGRYTHADDAAILVLPYAGDALEMVFVLPDHEDGLPSLEEHLDADRVGRWAENAYDERLLEVALPRFRIETEALGLSGPLTALGMGPAFADGADFSGMSDRNDLHVSEVFHRVFVEVNEEGTEAAAATAVVMVEESAVMREPPRFVADHPFLFFLRDRTNGAILFLGRVVDPR